MTVGQLIEKLQKFDVDKTIYTLTDEENPLLEGSTITDVIEISGSSFDSINGVYIRVDIV